MVDVLTRRMFDPSLLHESEIKNDFSYSRYFRFRVADLRRKGTLMEHRQCVVVSSSRYLSENEREQRIHGFEQVYLRFLDLP